MNPGRLLAGLPPMNPQPLWDWMNLRHRIYLARKAGQPYPWSKDEVLNTYSFCNVFRELDTVTVWIKQTIREPFREDPLLWLMLALARTINWPPTLHRIMDAGLWPTRKRGFDAIRTADLLDAMVKAGEKVYTGAYMIRAESDPGKAWYTWTKQHYICRIVIGALYEKRDDFHDCFQRRDVPQPSLEHVWRWLTKFHGWGPFMAYEVVTDLRHTPLLQNAPDIYTWANAGPGALRGLNRLLGRDLTAPLSPEAATLLMRHLMDEANEGYETNTGPLDAAVYEWSGEPAPLEMRDIEHSLCETDKWLRAKEGSGKPRAKFHLAK